jgi:hypothetical protein
MDPEEEIKKVLQGNKYATSMPLIWSARWHTVFPEVHFSQNAVQESRHFHYLFKQIGRKVAVFFARFRALHIVDLR